MCICLIDTSVFLNLLNVPGRNQDKVKVNEDFISFTDLGSTFLLPMATIIETGNHIAQNGDGSSRRKSALRFIDAVKGSYESKAPWRATEFPNLEEIMTWLDCFPDYAGKNKAPSKPEGTSFGDLSIIKEFEKACSRFPLSEVFVWSLDSDLACLRRPRT